MAGSALDKPEMLSDGKRVRTVWRPEHGDGDSAEHVVIRCRASVKGHPTWKIFIDDIPTPIIRGSKQEPPHYAYLDDKACYTIWRSKAYTDAELRMYWPFDFDHQGNISAGRKNRGRPAWADDGHTEYAKATLRSKNKNKWYEFSGAPDVTEYKPLRPVVKTKMERLVEAEISAKRTQLESETDENYRNESTVDSTSRTPTRKASTSRSSSSTGTPLTNTNDFYPAQLSPRRWQTPSRPLPEQSLMSGVRPLPIPSRSMTGPSCDDAPYNAKRSVSETRPSKNRQRNSTTSPKRKYIQPFDLSSSSESCLDSPATKRLDLGSQHSSRPALPSKTSFPSGNDDVWPKNVAEGVSRESERPRAREHRHTDSEQRRWSNGPGQLHPSPPRGQGPRLLDRIWREHQG